ncbi:hypothetical protein LTR56_028092, partial [Elasticomyces elasticus]
VQLTKKSVTVMEAMQLSPEEPECGILCNDDWVGSGLTGGLLLRGAGPEGWGHNPAMTT